MHADGFMCSCEHVVLIISPTCYEFIPLKTIYSYSKLKGGARVAVLSFDGHARGAIDIIKFMSPML